jgi:hypothetical protein
MILDSVAPGFVSLLPRLVLLQKLEVTFFIKRRIRKDI